MTTKNKNLQELRDEINTFIQKHKDDFPESWNLKIVILKNQFSDKKYLSVTHSRIVKPKTVFTRIDLCLPFKYAYELS